MDWTAECTMDAICASKWPNTADPSLTDTAEVVAVGARGAARVIDVVVVRVHDRAAAPNVVAAGQNRVLDLEAVVIVIAIAMVIVELHNRGPSRNPSQDRGRGLSHDPRNVAADVVVKNQDRDPSHALSRGHVKDDYHTSTRVLCN